MSSRKAWKGKYPLTSRGSYWDSSELEIIGNLNQTNSDNNYETSNSKRETFYGGNRQAFSFAILSYTIPFEFNILQLLSGQRRNMNNVCQFISDHLMNEYIQDCDYKAVSLNETKI